MILLQPPTARARWVGTDLARVPTGLEGVAEALGIAGRVLVPSEVGEPAVPDGNRTLVLPERTIELGGQRFALSVKGAGAVSPMYGDPLDDALEDGAREFLGERWFGEAPYGGQGATNAEIALEITSAARGAVWNGFHLCPVVQVVEVPPAFVRGDRFWYRRHQGPVLQEHRLVPSDVRLFHAAEHTLGQDPDRVLGAFGVTDASAVDAFLERTIRTGFAALTLFLRTAREVPWGLHGLGYGNVWLDKDSVVAPDGSLYFADLEGLDWRLAGADWTVDEVAREQLEHNLYEVLFGMDVVQRYQERLTGRALSIAERRRKMALRVELALDDDPFLTTERSGGGLDLVARTPLRPDEPVVFRLFDDTGEA
ncbi:MAG: hypothetical protein H6738_23900 [Alphaproteobacteria bacterium]|nr:hypothetical protein [Alphaproteobacteria bacterium]MCB9699852.1 hypothetical protein [Alphaproteobacteria bacterium]